MDDLLADFLTETNEGLSDLDVALVKLERTPDDGETLSLIFRLVHTIKGTCGFLGLPRLEHVAHAAENVLGKVRDGVLTVTPDMISLVLKAVDQIKAILAGLAATGGEPAGDDSDLIAALNATATGQPAPERTPAPAAVAPQPVEIAPVQPPAAEPQPPEPQSKDRSPCQAGRARRRLPPRHRLRQPRPPRDRTSFRASRSPPSRPSGSPWTCWKT